MRDRSYEIPGAVRVTVGTRAQVERFLEELEPYGLKGVIAFDMDGVLVEVGESYRETIVQTVAHFSGATITRDQIQDYKNAGGWNNDWALSQKILADLGHEVAYAAVVDQFNKLFLGENGQPGLIMRERWIARDGLLERLVGTFPSRRFSPAGCATKRT